MNKHKTVFIVTSKHNFYLNELLSTYVLKKNYVPLKQFSEFQYPISKMNINIANTQLLLSANEIWVFGKISSDMLEKINLAIKNHKKIRLFQINEYSEHIQEIKQINRIVFEEEIVKQGYILEKCLKDIQNHILTYEEIEIEQEIERKWILNEIPSNFDILLEADVEQLYISMEPEVRIRKRIEKGKNPICFMDVKGMGDLSRKEISTIISEEEFEEIKNIIAKPPITKKYYKLNIGEKKYLEVSVVDQGTENEFIYAELEFDSEKEAKEFVPPVKVTKEVTFDPKYKMKNYWKRTRLL